MRMQSSTSSGTSSLSAILKLVLEEFEDAGRNGTRLVIGRLESQGKLKELPGKRGAKCYTLAL